MNAMTFTSTRPAPAAAAPVVREHLVISVVLPDRPGALGAVASRIGSLSANITDITVASRHAGTAEDEFHLNLPHSETVDVLALLLSELREVDGVSATSWRHAHCCS